MNATVAGSIAHYRAAFDAARTRHADTAAQRTAAFERFAALGFPMDLEMQPYVNLTKGALKAVPLIVVLGPAFLMGMNALAKRRDEGEPAPAQVAPNHRAKGGPGHGR